MTSDATPPDATGSGPAVELRSVSRGFGEVKALDDLTLVAPAHSITVLLGPNGAGKTTAIRMITGALNPDTGEVRVFGLDPAVDGEQVRTRCGVVSAKPALYDRLTGWDNLGYAAELLGLGRGDAAATAIRESAARFGIDDALDQQVGGYSTGMKTRLALARSVMHGPDLLLFDEPTSGLDPESSHAVLELIREMADTGSTVIMCTHLLLEAEGLAEKVVVLDGGTDLIAGSPDELTKRFWPHLVVRLDAEDPAGLDLVAGMDGVVTYERDDRGLAASGSGAGGATVQLDDLARVPEVVFALARAGVRVTRVEPHVPSLEDLYFAVRDGRHAFSEKQGHGTTGTEEVAA